MDTLRNDFRYALRTLRRSPAFTLATILTLALGIGATTAIYSIVDGVLLRPVPFANANQVAMVWETDRNSGTTREPSSIPDFADFQARSQAFASFAAVTPVELNVATASGDPARLAGLGVSHRYFGTVGLQPLVGRVFTDAEDRVGGAPAVLISEDLWEQRFSRDAAIVGKTLRLNEADVEIVGVMARGSDFGALQMLGAADYQRGFADRGGRPRVDLWVPLRASPSASRNSHPIFVIGRLAPTSSMATAQRELTAIATDLELSYPQDNVGRGVFIEPLSTVVFGNIRSALYLLGAAVGLVLLVACTNVANLLLARAANRSREVTVRTALGASRARLAQQFAVESALLVAGGASGGLALAFAAVRVTRAVAPATIPRAETLQVQGDALLLTAVISIVIATVFGLLPVLHSRRQNLQSALQAEGRGNAGGRMQRLARASLVVAQLSMATTLTITAVLLIRSLATLQGVDPGFDANHVLKAEFQLPESRYPHNVAEFPNWPEIQQFQVEALSRIGALPGVESVALAAANPMDAGSTSSIRVVGREEEGRSWPEPSLRPISADYLATMRVPLRSGRAFTRSDDMSAPPVVLINDAARQRYFNGHEPLGAQVQLWGQARTVVGVIGDERFKGLATPAAPALYMPLGQSPIPSAVLVRTTGDPMLLAPSLRAVMRELDPQLAVFGVEPLTETISGTVAERRFTMLMLAMFALSALVLAIVGVHGVLSYSVAQRTREIGIRIALGADVGRVKRLILQDGAQLAAYGVTIGLVGAFALSRIMRSMLFGVGANDPGTFIGVAVLLVSVALAASWFPARRAARVEPMEALRSD